MKLKISLIYLSITGNTEKVAGFIDQGLCELNNIETKLMNIIDEKNVDIDFINKSKGIIFGTPTYCAEMCWQLKKWFDENFNINLSGKIGSAFATANCIHGGADIALTSILKHAMVKGMLTYSSGAGCGRPFIHLGPVAINPQLDEKKDLFTLFGKRVGEKTLELFHE